MITCENSLNTKNDECSALVVRLYSRLVVVVQTAPSNTHLLEVATNACTIGPSIKPRPLIKLDSKLDGGFDGNSTHDN